jgi:hypothetical protein
VLRDAGGSAVTNLADLAAFKARNKLVFASYGSRELGGNRPGFGGDPKANAEALQQAGINSHFYVSSDTAHEWQSWRRSLRELAPLLFRECRTSGTWTSTPTISTTGRTRCTISRNWPFSRPRSDP